MKKNFLSRAFFCLPLSLIVIMLNSVAAYAHAPKEVILAYNKDSQTLTVTITHKSPSPNFHYIDKVEIKNNGTVVSTNEYKSQPDKETFDYSYKVKAAEGDKIEVKATCSLFGSKTVNLIIQKLQ